MASSLSKNFACICHTFRRISLQWSVHKSEDVLQLSEISKCIYKRIPYLEDEIADYLHISGIKYKLLTS